MHNQLSTYTTVFLVIVSFATTACERGTDSTAAALTGPSALASTSLRAEPAVISAEFQSSPACRTDAPFDARLNVTLRPSHEVFIRRFVFEFVDPLGRTAVPLVFAGPIEVNNSVVLPIPLPTTHPIPFPGETRMSSVVSQGAFFKVPFRLRFDCGVPARGTLFVSVETADDRGRVEVSRASAEIR